MGKGNSGRRRRGAVVLGSTLVGCARRRNGPRLRSAYRHCTCRLAIALPACLLVRVRACVCCSLGKPRGGLSERTRTCTRYSRRTCTFRPAYNYRGHGDGIWVNRASLGSANELGQVRTEKVERCGIDTIRRPESASRSRW